MTAPDVDALAADAETLAKHLDIVALNLGGTAKSGDTIRALLAALRGARADGERLDWLERTIRDEDAEWAGVTLGWEDCEREQFRVYRQLDEAGTWGVFTNEMCEAETGLRTAIDAARAAGDPK